MFPCSHSTTRSPCISPSTQPFPCWETPEQAGATGNGQFLPAQPEPSRDRPHSDGGGSVLHMSQRHQSGPGNMGSCIFIAN